MLEQLIHRQKFARNSQFTWIVHLIVGFSGRYVQTHVYIDSKSPHLPSWNLSGLDHLHAHPQSHSFQ
jgi:hypothetical protein